MLIRPPDAPSLGRRVLHRLLVATGALTMTTACFFALPLLQAISNTIRPDTLIVSADVAALPPPPPPPLVEEPEPEPEPEEPPPDIEQPNLELSQLDLLLGNAAGGGVGFGQIASLGDLSGSSSASEALVGWEDLDQRPRVLQFSQPEMTDAMRRVGGKAWIVFMVDEQGNVVSPSVQKVTDPMFKRPALEAIKRWKFEPGKRNGKPVRFRMRQPMTFPKKK